MRVGHLPGLTLMFKVLNVLKKTFANLHLYSHCQVQKTLGINFFILLSISALDFFLNRDGSTSSALPSTSFSAWVYSNLVNLHRRSFTGHQNCGYRARLTSADESSTHQVEINLLKNVI